MFDGDKVRLTLYPEHIKAIERAGYDASWKNSPADQIAIEIPVIVTWNSRYGYTIGEVQPKQAEV